MDNIHTFLGKLEGVKGQGTNFTARCPGHDDRVNSLSITEADGKLLVKCHAGCEIGDVLKPLDLTVADLFFKNGRSPRTDRRPPGDRVIDRAYLYRDAEGTPLFEVVRFRPKSFAQRRPGGQWGLGDVQPVLYHLPEVLTAVQKGDLIYIVEGEKDADNLWAIGCVATTSPMGAGKWRDSYTEVLKDARVAIIPDNDKAGRAHAYHIATTVQQVARLVKMVELPAKVKDVSVWLEDGHTWEDLEQLVAATPPWQPPEELADAPLPGRDFHLTDLGNAERLVAMYGNIIRYCYERRRWLVWTGKVWQWDRGALVTALAKRTIRSIYHQVADEPDEKKRDALLAHARKSESDARISAMLSLAQSEEGIPVQLGELDQGPLLFNCLNGTVDLTTGDLLPHRRRDMLTILCPVEYDPGATAPMWERFLARVTDNNQELATYLQTTAGYSMTADTRLQVLFFLYGLGNNGKSTFVRTLRTLMAGYGHKASTDIFLARDRASSGPREDLASLYGKRFVIASEIQEGRKLAIVLIKEMTGGEAITADRKYEHQVEFQPTHKIWLSGNHKPIITDTTLSIWRRVKLVPFTVTIPDEEIDDTLGDRMVGAELPGILAWAVRGAVRWYRDGLREPAVITSATTDYRQEQDILGEFLQDRCVQMPTATSTKAQLKDTYRDWCNQTGYQPIGERTFRTRLLERGIAETRHGKARMWRGVGILSENGDSNDKK